MRFAWLVGSMRRVPTVAVALLAILTAGAGPGMAEGLLGIRTGVHRESLRVVLDLEGDVSCFVRQVEGTDDWVIEIVSGCPADLPPRITNPHPLVRAIVPSCHEKLLRVDLLAASRFGAHAFVIPPRSGMPLRYVVDLYPSTLRPVENPPEETAAASPQDEPLPEPQPRGKGPWKIVIDPGHGGRDTGATARGIQEKEVVLDVGRRIAKILNEDPGFEAELTRGVDRYIGLRRRKTFAEDYEADAFISVHANAARASRAVGVEVFFVSLSGASDEASLELARLENEADPEYVVEEDALLQQIPFGFDLRQTDTIRRSSHLAESVLTGLEQSGLAASRGVKQAGFVVLKSFQVPSILVEIGFLSNPNEAKRLKTSAHRQRLAETIAAGTIAYFDRFARARATEEPVGP